MLCLACMLALWGGACACALGCCARILRTHVSAPRSRAMIVGWGDAGVHQSQLHPRLLGHICMRNVADSSLHTVVGVLM